jgi:hypothetical protein
MEELLPNRCMVAIARSGHKPPAVVANVLDGPPSGVIALVRHQDREDDDEEPNDDADGEALEASLDGLER